MGNCQAAEAATVLIQHPGGRVERLYWSLSASQVMASNPGHYVALIITSTPNNNNNRSSSGGNTAAPVKHLKLLRPDDTLHIGHVYSLVSFEEVLKEFVSKKHVKLSRSVVAHKDKASSKRGGGGRGGGRAADAKTSSPPVAVEAEEVQWVGSGGSRSVGGGAPSRQGQWRPALQSIAETAS